MLDAPINPAICNSHRRKRKLKDIKNAPLFRLAENAKGMKKAGEAEEKSISSEKKMQIVREVMCCENAETRAIHENLTAYAKALRPTVNVEDKGLYIALKENDEYFAEIQLQSGYPCVFVIAESLPDCLIGKCYSVNKMRSFSGILDTQYSIFKEADIEVAKEMIKYSHAYSNTETQKLH